MQVQYISTENKPAVSPQLEKWAHFPAVVLKERQEGTNADWLIL